MYMEGQTHTHSSSFPKLEVDGGNKQSRCPSPPYQHLASGKQQLPPSLGFLGGEQQQSQLHCACVQSKNYLLLCAAGSLLTSLHPLQHKYLVTKQCGGQMGFRNSLGTALTHGLVFFLYLANPLIHPIQLFSGLVGL